VDIIEIIKQPLFWVLSGLVSVILSVVANLLTPFIVRQLVASKGERRRKILQEQLALREQVLIFQQDPNLRASAKLDAIYWILRAVLLFALALLVMQIIAALPIAEIAAVLILLIAALCMARSGQWITRGKSRVRTAFLAEEREADIADFCKKNNCIPTSSDAMKFAIQWDQSKFGLKPDDITNANKSVQDIKGSI
jgi:hypothetical protein